MNYSVLTRIRAKSRQVLYSQHDWTSTFVVTKLCVHENVHFMSLRKKLCFRPLYYKLYCKLK